MAVVAFGGGGSFAFEVNVVHEGVGAEGLLEDAVEIFFDFCADLGRGGGEDFWKGLVEAEDGEAGLVGYGVFEDVAKGEHARAVEVAEKFLSGIPWAGA